MTLSNAFIMTILVSTALVLSGCTGGGGDTTTASPPLSPTMGDDTGAIEGLVTNDELEPIANAQAAIEGIGEPTTSDENGQFVFSQVPPGKHVVYLTALGYGSVARSVDVAVGEIAKVNIQLEPIGTDEPFSTKETKDGYITCGTGVGREGVVGATQVACGSNDPNQKFLFTYEFEEGLKGILYEMEWRPTQALSKHLTLVVEKDGCGVTCGDDDVFAESQGCCTVRIFVPVENMTKPDGEEPATDFTEKGGKIQSRTFPAYGEGDNPATVFTGQAFKIHVEYFYNGLPADIETRTNVVVG